MYALYICIEKKKNNNNLAKDYCVVLLLPLLHISRVSELVEHGFVAAGGVA